jgi:wyosine [tRNA(Phe)-imidazoG37] synthetase (radical SAM superfamily)
MRKINHDEIERLILNSAIEANILPITSRCDSRCIFCSHKNNPRDIDVISVGVRSMEDITRTLAFLNPRNVITIGESATQIIEGEPLSHPQFNEILSLTRRAYPETPMEITTNGRRLTREMVEFLKEKGNINLNISLNSASVHGRKLLMGDNKKQSEQTLEGIRLLAEYNMPFSSSMVAMPNITGWDDLLDTIEFLAANKATAIRVFMPSFSSRAKADIFPDEDKIYGQLRDFINTLSPELPCPVLIEPSNVSDLIPVVSGVLKDSPAWRAGMRRGEIILQVNGLRPRCRVEAWNMLVPKGKIDVEVRKNGSTETVSWVNECDGDSGITMEYDFDPARAENLKQTILDCPGKSLLLTSEFGFAVIQKVLELIGADKDRAEPVMAKNRTFGGTIRAAGLLTVDDYLETYTVWRTSNQKPSQLIIPLESFNSLGFDLKHRNFSELQNMTGIRVVLK